MLAISFVSSDLQDTVEESRRISRETLQVLNEVRAQAADFKNINAQARKQLAQAHQNLQVGYADLYKAQNS